MEDIMDLSFFGGTQLIGHFAYFLKYGKWVIISRGNFWAFLQYQATP
jgi:hypothetical protein